MAPHQFLRTKAPSISNRAVRPPQRPARLRPCLRRSARFTLMCDLTSVRRSWVVLSCGALVSWAHATWAGEQPHPTDLETVALAKEAPAAESGPSVTNAPLPGTQEENKAAVGQTTSSGGTSPKPAFEGAETGTASLQDAVTRGPASPDYAVRFEKAREALLENRDEEALEQFDALSAVAPSLEDRRVAEEFAALARERLETKKRALPPPHLRTPDELSVLYTTAFTYGFGTSAWLALQIKPSNFAAAILPFIAITTASVGSVALIDDYSPFRLGVPQSIAAGTVLGTVEGVWIAGYQHAVATRRHTQRWRAPTVSTFLWAGATAGGVVGGLLGAVREPTPGQVAFTTSSAWWGGIAGALIAGASESQKEYRSERAFAIGAVGYNAALVTALAVSPSFAPSMARIRLVDLGGLAGGLLGAGGYLLVADKDASSRASLGAAAGGAVLGLGLSWWATSGMPEEPHPIEDDSIVARLKPSVVPVRQGAIGVVELAL